MTIDGYGYPSLIIGLAVVAVASMLVGNLLALLQDNIKRLLAYSSIAHLGYILVALLAGGEMAVEAVLYYLVAYTITITGAFAIVGVLEDEEEVVNLDDYRGLFWRRPWPAAALTAMMLSLAGIPLTAGFVGKFLVLTAGIGAALWTLAIILVIGSAISIFYYVRVVAVMFSKTESESAQTPSRMPVLGRLVLLILTLALFFFGVFPGSLVGFIRSMVAGVL
jgi:NADH-quinone oxidoreductase subunit N